MTGTLVNAAAIVAGSLLGAWIHARLPQKIVQLLFRAMGLVTLSIAFPMAARSANFPLVVVAVASGAILGQWMDLDGLLRRAADRLCRRLSTRFPGDASGDRFASGLIAASMLFCVGSMAILGPIEEGAGNAPALLYTKSVMDGITSVALAASFGLAILFSAIPVLLYQGTLTLLSVAIARVASASLLADLSSTGGILLIGLGITLLEVKEINITNMLPALPIIALLSALFG
ncbi:MAG: DUF554 domain-containing protein [Odoribacteraceae bacterium]|jgi:uncharacterized membrane protein YqgA involved in biofilm formation|nr:DUF554 domain-containing protein [Odoribacteraceae bacterium]